MLKSVTIRSTLAAVACLMSFSVYAMADSVKRIDIPRGQLTTALQSLAKQTGTEFIYSSEQLKDIQTEGVHGNYTTEKAVTKLLQGTKLHLTTHESGAFLISDNSASARSEQKNEGTEERSDPKEETQSKSFWDRFRMAQMDKGPATVGSTPNSERTASASATSSGASSSSEHEGRLQLEEVVVSAQKRVERLQDVPVPVTALGAQSLIDSNQVRIQDYYLSVPGLNLTPTTGPGNGISIRGITTGGGGYQTPTVGITIDDVPYGASSGLAFAGLVPDIDPSDLQRIEVLRGPQGTLYGAASIGGLLKYVTVDPSPEALTGRVEADLNDVHHGDGVGYGVRGSANVPVGDTAAVRASAFTRRDAGYIDNPILGIKGINRTDVNGGRLSALWHPAEGLSLKLGALLQTITADGGSAVMMRPDLADLQQSGLPGTGGYDQRLQLYTANVTSKFGGAELVAASGYGIYKQGLHADLTPFGYGYYSNIFYPGSQAARGDWFTETKKFTQELRLSSSIGSRFDWLLGAFYTHEANDPISTPNYAADSASGAPIGLLFDSEFPSTYVEYAGFADLTIHFTNRFNIQFGGRESSNRQGYNEVDSGPAIPLIFGAASPLVPPPIHTKDNSFTYLVTPQFKFSSDLMAYARLASGYRPGGPNPDANLLGFPLRVQPDKTTNYELGAKGEFLDHMLSFDASFYYIDWKDIQILVTDQRSGFAFYTNASSAKSQGAELSLQARPISGLAVGAWAAWNEAKLTSDLPPRGTSVGLSGDPLPYSSRFSGNLSLEQSFPITDTLTGSLGGSISYIGSRKGAFAGNFTQVRPTMPAYAKADLHASVQHGPWSVNGYVDNVVDKRGYTGVGFVGQVESRNVIRPRTLGLSITRTFGADTQ